MSDTVQNGKGDKRRPSRVSDDEIAANWRRIFGRVNPREEAVVPEQPAPEPPLLELTSIDHHYITGRGHVYDVPNPRDTQNDQWDCLMGRIIRLDGRKVRVRAIENYRTFGLYPAGRTIGLIVDEIAEDHSQ